MVDTVRKQLTEAIDRTIDEVLGRTGEAATRDIWQTVQVQYKDLVDEFTERLTDSAGMALVGQRIRQRLVVAEQLALPGIPLPAYVRLKEGTAIRSTKAVTIPQLMEFCNYLERLARIDIQRAMNIREQARLLTSIAKEHGYDPNTVHIGILLPFFKPEPPDHYGTQLELE